jgi:hypothetical protein
MTSYLVVDRAIESPINAATAYSYHGIDRAPWACVDLAYYRGELPAKLAIARRESFRRREGNLSFGLLGTLDEVRSLAHAAGCSPTLQVALSIGSLGVLHELPDSLRSDGLGLDVYVDGFGSPLALADNHVLDIAGDVGLRLTADGLFSSVADAKRYWDRYVDTTEKLNLEPVVNVGPVWLYDVLLEVPL